MAGNGQSGVNGPMAPQESLWLPSPSVCWGRGAGGEGAKMLDTLVDRVLDQTPDASRIS